MRCVECRGWNNCSAHRPWLGVSTFFWFPQAGQALCAWSPCKEVQLSSWWHLSPPFPALHPRSENWGHFNWLVNRGLTPLKSLTQSFKSPSLTLILYAFTPLGMAHFLRCVYPRHRDARTLGIVEEARGWELVAGASSPSFATHPAVDTWGNPMASLSLSLSSSKIKDWEGMS